MPHCSLWTESGINDVYMYTWIFIRVVIMYFSGCTRIFDVMHVHIQLILNMPLYLLWMESGINDVCMEFRVVDAYMDTSLSAMYLNSYIWCYTCTYTVILDMPLYSPWNYDEWCILIFESIHKSLLGIQIIVII
jgi:hypothetical protein